MAIYKFEKNGLEIVIELAIKTKEGIVENNLGKIFERLLSFDDGLVLIKKTLLFRALNGYVLFGNDRIGYNKYFFMLGEIVKHEKIEKV
jgi:hypothetical protein